MTNSNAKDKILSLEIMTPDGKFEKDFPKTAKVQDVIDAVVQEFQYSQQGKYELHLADDDTELDPQRPLVSYDIEDGSKLIFTELGKAV